MEFKRLIFTIASAVFLSAFPLSHFFAEEIQLTSEDIALFQKEVEIAKQVEDAANLSAKKPIVITNAQVMSVIAYTNTDFPTPWVDHKVVYIPEGWNYYTHSVRETTGLGNRKIYEPWVVRDPKNPSRIIEVHVKVEAFARWFGRSWVGAELAVVIVPHSN